MSQPPNGRRYRQGRDLADKTIRRRIRRWGCDPESVGDSPHLSGARGVSRISFILTKLVERVKSTYLEIL